MIFLVLISMCVILIVILVTRKKKYWINRGLVQEDGVIWRFTFGDRSLAEYSKEIYNKYKEDQIGMYLGSAPGLMLKNLDDIQAVLAGDFQSFHERGIDLNKNDLLADNLLFIGDYQRWKILRQKMTPVFTSLRLKTMFYSIERCARDFVDLIEKNEKLREKPFDVLYTYTSASIGTAVFGIDTIGANPMESPFVNMAWKVLKPSMFTHMTFLLSGLSPTLFKMSKLRIFGEYEEFFIGAVKSVFEARRSSEKRNDFIDVCLELQKNGMMIDPNSGYELEPSDEVLAAQAFFFFLAGADTTANSIHFSILELAGNQPILTRLHEIIDEVFKDGKTELTYEDLDKLQYLDMIVNEAMRKYPPIGQIQRVCTKNTVLPSNNLKIEKGTEMIIPIYAIHRDETLFPNPDSFDPERFAPDRVKDMKNYSYMAFGGGNRICIGVRFARLQIKACLAHLLRRFTLAEQEYKPKRFEKSSFSLRDADAKYKLIPRNIKM